MGVINSLDGVAPVSRVGSLSAALARVTAGAAPSQRHGFRRSSAAVSTELDAPVHVQGGVSGWVP